MLGSKGSGAPHTGDCGNVLRRKKQKHHTPISEDGGAERPMSLRGGGRYDVKRPPMGQATDLLLDVAHDVALFHAEGNTSELLFPSHSLGPVDEDG